MLLVLDLPAPYAQDTPGQPPPPLTYSPHHPPSGGNVTLTTSPSTAAVASTAPHAAVMIAITSLSLLCNLLLVLTVLLHRRLRRAGANLLLCHLASAGAAHAAVCLPGYIGAVVTAGTERSAVSWVCTLQGSTLSMLSCVCTLTLALISVDKYRTLAAPLHYPTAGPRRRRLGLALLAVWAGAGGAGALPALVGPGYVYVPAALACDLRLPGPGLGLATVPALLALAFLLPATTLAVCYWRIHRIATRHRKRISAMLAMVMVSFQAPVAPCTAAAASQPRDQKASRTIGVYVGSFFAVYAPYAALCLLQMLLPLGGVAGAGPTVPAPAVAAVTALYHSAPLVNAAVYGSRNRALRYCLLCTVRQLLYSRHHVNQLNSLREAGLTPPLRGLRPVQSTPLLASATTEAMRLTTLSNPGGNGVRGVRSTPDMHGDAGIIEACVSSV